MLAELILSTILLSTLVVVIEVPSLAERLRLRLIAIMEERGDPHIALARHLGVGKSQISRILGDEQYTAAVSIRKLESMSDFTGVPAPDLFRSGAEETMTLSPVEQDLIEYFRLFPSKQQEQILGILSFTFEPRREAIAERRRLGILRLSLQRQIEAMAKAR